jgi:hypothetical protein
MDEWLVFFILVSLIAFWWSSSNAYESAYQAARGSCKSNGVHLLDDTLARSKISLCRHVNGYIQFCRQYRFEFSTDGEMRYMGTIFLSGSVVNKVEMDAYREE